MIKTGTVLLVLRRSGGESASAVATLIRSLGYQVDVVPRDVDPVPRIRESGCFVTCFDFDYPDLPGLAELQRTKREVPSVPVLMLTCAHSEAIAVWAFRSRVWDYFVDPIDLDRFRLVLQALSELPRPGIGPTHGRLESDGRRIVEAPQGFPLETRMRPRGVSPEPVPALDAVLSYIDRNLHKKILQSEVAAISRLSPFQFSRAFKRYFEMTFQEYVLRRRIAEAIRLLRHPGVSVSDVCFTVGFKDPSYFTRTFQRYVGETPSVYRLSARKEAGIETRAADAAAEHLLAVPTTQAAHPQPC